MNSKNPGWKQSAGFSLLLALAVVGGVLVERVGWLPGSRYAADAPAAPFWEAWRLVENHYVDRKAVQSEAMSHGAIRGMLSSLGDTGHTTFLTKEDFTRLEKNLAGQLEGIGARLTLRKGRPTVVQTFPNSPARRAGLLPGDVFLKVAGQNVNDLPLPKVVELIRGVAGTLLQVQVQRAGKVDPLEPSIPREKVDVPDVTWQILPGTSIAHVALVEFGKQADSQLKTALEEARRQGAQGLILDVRGNPGGLKDQAVAVTSEFLKSGTVFLEQDAAGHRTAVPVRGGGQATQIPLCVLIDEGTASSAEIFAGAIQDHGRGKLVGTRTFGTGTVLQPFGLSDGSVVMLAVREWLTPSGRQIWHQGITPDVVVALPPGVTPLLPDTGTPLDAAGLAKSDDRQLLKALELLKEQVKDR